MTEDEAKSWVAARFEEATFARLDTFVAKVISENGIQNLISPSTVSAIWARHVVDSAQLMDLVPAGWSSWIDVGTGGGFPGMVVALVAPERKVTMVEPRRKRADFLRTCVNHFGLPDASVVQARIEAFADSADVISARAVSSIQQIVHAAAACARFDTTWVLPRGTMHDTDHVALRAFASTLFHVEHSVTDSASSILILQGDGR